MKNTVEFQKAYIPDAKVKELRDVAGVTNFSEFVRQCVANRINEARRNLPQNQTGNTNQIESNPKLGAV